MAEAASLEYKSLLERLDALQRAGQGNTAKADAVRCQMDRPWYSMTEKEQTEIERYSAELYTRWTPEELAREAGNG